MTGLLELVGRVELVEPGRLALALLLLPAAILGRRGPAPALRWAPAPLLAAPPGTWRTRLGVLPRVLQALGLMGVVLALARPALPRPLPATRVGIDLLLGLDVSSSMQTKDLDGARTRLEVAREAALDFVRGRPDDRIGLLVFARYPDLRCPPTRDHDALARIVADVGTVEPDGPEDATGIGLAAARGVEVLAGGPGPSRVLVLLTDGEENVAIEGVDGEVPPEHAAQLAARLGVRVTTIVVGRARRDAAGELRPLDVRAVRRLAARTGGTFHQVEDAGALRAVYREIDALEKGPLEDPETVLEDVYPAVLALALALVLGGRVLDAWIGRSLP